MRGVIQPERPSTERNQWITVQCNGVAARSLGAWTLSRSSERKRRYAEIVCTGVYTDGLVRFDQNPVPARGAATLELYFSQSEMGAHAGLLTDLAGDGSHLEISAEFSESMLSWTDELLSQASDEKPIHFTALRNSKGHFSRVSLSLSAPGILPLRST